MNPQVPSPLGQQPYWSQHPQTGEHPPSTLPPPPSHPSAPTTNGGYHPPPPQATSTLPPLTDPRASMATAGPYQHQGIPPPPHAHYQRPPYQQPLPGPNQLYGMPAHPDYRAAYAAQPQTAPRQRTAIACKYCRRRKIRCSGFDTSEDGKCTNCTRFNQECVFMPVSNSSSQAFVPVHAAFGRGPPPPYQQLYGPLGNPLPPQTDSFGRPAPPPPGGYQSPATPYPPQAQAYPQPPQGYDDRSNASTSTMPYHTPPAPQQQPYYPPPGSAPGPHPSPPAPYPPHEPPRASTSPHSQASPSGMGPATPSSGSYPYHGASASDPSLRPYPMRPTDGRTPPPQQSAQPAPPASTTSSNGQRPGISISSIVSDGASPGTRSTTDSDMLNRLSRP